jgi:phosphatidylserine/phosphatidylglycerophosphate/cardiolipin synthase-like enzyme
VNPIGSRVSLVASGRTWVGEAARSVDSALREVIKGATSELHVTLYTASEEAISIFDLLEEQLEKGVRLTLVVNRLRESKQAEIRRRLESLGDSFPESHIYAFEPTSSLRNLHAKVVVADRTDAIIGSSNLSLRGLVENYELGIRLSGPIARDVSLLIDELARDPECRPVSSKHLEFDSAL